MAGKRRRSARRRSTAANPRDLPPEIAELHEAIRARDECLAVAAHELRNPMTPIGGQVELLLKAAQRDGAPMSIIRGLERLDRMIDTYVKRTVMFLDVARLNSGNLHCQSEPLDLSQVVLDLSHALKPAARRAGCRFETAVEAEVEVRADLVAVEQILENFMINALKYGAGRPVELSLVAGAENARTTVRDQGPGIALDDQRRIFEKFERAVSNRSREGGFGIGLWISNQLASAMGGSIDISSAIGAGSAFTLNLPVVKI
jgi:two-component system, OmpR family, sensor kinase